MAYFLLIPAMVPMAIATQSVIGEKQWRARSSRSSRRRWRCRSCWPARPWRPRCRRSLATWFVFVVYGLVNSAIADPQF